MTHEVRYLAHHLLHAGLTPLAERDRRLVRRLARRLHASVDGRSPPIDRPTLGERLADRVASAGGSWGFIVGFSAFLVIWAGVNAFVLASHAFDPYPFVFLNLILSMVAALQAPVILMSQNRQASKDRIAAALAHEVSLASEASLAELHGKVDALSTLLSRPQPKGGEPSAPAANDIEALRHGLRAVV